MLTVWSTNCHTRPPSDALLSMSLASRIPAQNHPPQPARSSISSSTHQAGEARERSQRGDGIVGDALAALEAHTAQRAQQGYLLKVPVLLEC